MANLAYAGGLADDAEPVDDGLPPGSILYDGQFQITRMVHCGDSGAVYGAKDSLGRDVFLKLCPRKFAPEAMAAEDGQPNDVPTARMWRQGIILQEAHYLSELHHPNIISFDQFIEAAATDQDLVPLSDRLDDPRPLGPQEILSLARKILDALRCIHESGRLHRQIRSQNILLNEEGEPFLIDFGSAGEFAFDASSSHFGPEDGDESTPQTEVDTAPEIWNDLRDLGVTLREAIVGDRSVVGQSSLTYCPETDADGHRLLAGQYEGYPPGFLESIDRAVLALPKDRFESADEWLEVLDRESNDEESSMKLLGRTIGLRRAGQNADKRPDPTPVVVKEEGPPPSDSVAMGNAASPGIQKKTTSMPKLYLEGKKMSVDLSGLKEISGFISGCLVDCDSGLMLASESVGKFDIETAAAANVDVVRGKQTAIRLLGLNDKIEDILISLGTQLHLIRPLEKMPTMFLYAALDRKTANLGMARLQVKKVEQGIKL